MTTSAARAKKDAGTPGFEQSLERLEKIVAQMESGDLALEQMIQCFEEGQALIKVCSTKLNEVERKIEVLVKKGEKVTAEPFEDTDESSDATPPTDSGAHDELF